MYSSVEELSELFPAFSFTSYCCFVLFFSLVSESRIFIIKAPFSKGLVFPSYELLKIFFPMLHNLDNQHSYFKLNYSFLPKSIRVFSSHKTETNDGIAGSSDAPVDRCRDDEQTSPESSFGQFFPGTAGSSPHLVPDVCL